MTVFGSIFLALSVACLIGSIFIGAIIRRADNKRCDIDVKSGVTISPFWIFLIGFFIAATLMFFPLYYCDYFAHESGFVRGFNSFMISVHNTMSMLVLNSSFDMVRDVMSDDTCVNAVLGNIYQVYAALLYIIAPVLSAGFVLQFFKSASAFLKYCAYPNADIYVMSELNEKSLALAHDIIINGDVERGNKKSRRLVVFTDVFDRNEEREYELIVRAKRLGAICLKRDITAIGFKQHRRGILRKIYMIGEDEDENMQQALPIIEKCRTSACYNTSKTEIYVFATSSESEILLNSIDIGALKVRRINENANMVLHMLCNNSIFEHANSAVQNAATDEKQKRKAADIPMNIVVVGCGGYGTELIRTLCWMGQMPGYALTVHVFDKDDAETIIRAAAPGLVDNNNTKKDGMPFYNIVFHGKTNVESYEFLQQVEDIDSVTTAFVTLGNDEMNIETAIKMRRQFGRAHIERGANIPPVFAVVYSPAKARTVGVNGLINERNTDYGITLIGDVNTRFSLENIERKNLEDLGEMYHTQYAYTLFENTKREVEQQISECERKRDTKLMSQADADKRISALKAEIDQAAMSIEAERARYNKFEYFRRASIARAIFYEYRWALGYVPRDTEPKDGSTEEKKRVEENTEYNDMLIDYEHKRWSAVTLADGYVYAKVRDDLAKTHNMLVPTSKLTESDRAKDAVVKVEHGYKIIKNERC